MAPAATSIINDWVVQTFESQKMLLFTVYIAFFLDYMLVTTVVPIIPDYLFDVSTYRTKEQNDSYHPQTGDKNLSDSQIFDTTSYHDSQQQQMSGTENIYTGLLFGSEGFVAFISNFLVGHLTTKIGYTVPMFTGFVVMFTSTMMFAFAESYVVLFVARSFQGFGCACTSTSGMGMLAQAYPDDAERGSAIGIALGGSGLGILIGPTYGGLLYQLLGKKYLFVILAIISIGDGVLQIFVLKPHLEKEEKEKDPMQKLLLDPYIMTAAGSLFVANLGIAALEPSLPLWMMHRMDAEPITTGLVFLSFSLGYLIATNVIGSYAHFVGRWLISIIGFVTIGCSLITIPIPTSAYWLAVPMGFSGVGLGIVAGTIMSDSGMVGAAMFPLMGHLMDARHNNAYGNLYAIGFAANVSAYALGPFCSGPIVSMFGFPLLLYGVAAINVLYIPLMLLLRNPPGTDTSVSE